MEIAFLDANILFSLAWRQTSKLHLLWSIPNVEYITSEYALDETRRNLRTDAQKSVLDSSIARLSLVTFPQNFQLPETISIPEKDLPILKAALANNAQYLITGDKRDFGKYFEHTIQGVMILPPAAFLQQKLS